VRSAGPKGVDHRSLRPGPEDEFGFMLIVPRAAQRDVVRRRWAFQRVRDDVVVVQEVPLRATASVV
jgi:hypothetical protein